MKLIKRILGLLLITLGVGGIAYSMNANVVLFFWSILVIAYGIILFLKNRNPWKRID